MGARFVWVLALALGCGKGDEASELPLDGPLGLGLGNPYPNHLLMDSNGLALQSGALPSGVALPDLGRLSWRDGFSPAQTSVLWAPGVDPSALPSFEDVRPGEGSVVMWDLTDGVSLPIMAELDAHPDADPAALVVRPLVALNPGHRVAVVVTDDAMDRLPALEQLLSDQPGDLNLDLAAHTRALVDEVVALGVDEAAISAVWEFAVATDAGRPLTSALDQTGVLGPADLPLVREGKEGLLPPMTFRIAEGTFPVTDFLIDDLRLNLMPDGTVTPTGETLADLYVHIPASVSAAEQGTVPVVLFGHGIFSQPANYLDDDDDESAVLALAEEGGFIVIGTRWRGLTSTDLVEVVSAANDFSLFDTVAERLVQGQVNTRILAEMAADGTLYADDVFLGEHGLSLPDPDRLYYYGISLGGIEGAVMLAHDPPIDAAALHVGGGFWSTMLERSSNWPTFEALMEDQIPLPHDRQVLYALSQLWWDAADPVTYVDALEGRSMLYQYSLGDEQVPNLTTEALARSIGLPILTPSVNTPYGLSAVTGPLGPGSQALVQFDPEVAFPPPTNRPSAEATGAHANPRTWVGTRQQIIAHFDPDAEGQIVHFCGTAACAESNQGD